MKNPAPKAKRFAGRLSIRKSTTDRLKRHITATGIRREPNTLSVTIPAISTLSGPANSNMVAIAPSMNPLVSPRVPSFSVI